MTQPILDPVDSGLDGIEDRASENWQASAPAAAFALHASESEALHLTLYGGISPLTGTYLSGPEWDLTASTVHYIQLNRDDSFTRTPTTAPAGWPNALAAGAWAVGVATAGVATFVWDDVRRFGPSAISGGAAISIRYVFSTTTTDADPGAGKLRLSNATQNAATVIRADLLDEYAVDWTAVLDTLDDSTSTIKGQIRLSHANTPSKWLTFNLTAIASPAGYRNLTVANTGSSAASPFANNDLILFEFTRTGDLGATGTTGPSGSTGFPYAYSTTTTASDPGAGTIRFNNATLSSATALYISETDSDTNPIAAEIATWDDSTSTIRSKLKVFHTTDPTKFAIFNITGTNTDNGTWDTVNLAYVVGNGTLSNADPVKILVFVTGDKGTAGAAGVVASVVAGANITVDATDPANPIVASTGGGSTSASAVRMNYLLYGAFNG